MGIDLIENGKSFWRFAMPVLLQIIGKNLLYGIFCFLVRHLKGLATKVGKTEQRKGEDRSLLLHRIS
jgi:hypothetical protein